MGYTPWGRKALDMTDTFTFIVVYNVVPISVVQQSDSLIHIRHSFFFFGCNLCHGGGGGISACVVLWSVYGQLRLQCMISHMISA